MRPARLFRILRIRIYCLYLLLYLIMKVILRVATAAAAVAAAAVAAAVGAAVAVAAAAAAAAETVVSQCMSGPLKCYLSAAGAVVPVDIVKERWLEVYTQFRYALAVYRQLYSSCRLNGKVNKSQITVYPSSQYKTKTRNLKKQCAGG